MTKLDDLQTQVTNLATNIVTLQSAITTETAVIQTAITTLQGEADDNPKLQPIIDSLTTANANIVAATSAISAEVPPTP